MSKNYYVLRTLVFFISLISFALFGFSFWIYTNFGAIAFQQFLFIANQGPDISGAVDPELVGSFILFVLFFPILLSLLFNLTLKYQINKPAFRFLAGFASVSLFAGSIFFSDIVLKFTDYIINLSYDTVIDENYVAPSYDLNAADGKSLILIYVESLDANFADSELYGENLLKELEESTKNWESFPTYTSDWQGYTIGALVTTQCGIPLLQSSETSSTNGSEEPQQVGGNEFGEAYEQFLPGAICLGDVLKEAGYSNIFMGGADSSFAGKGKFLSQHGYDLILSRTYWEQKGEDYFNNWGLPDDRLLENARDVVLELRQKNELYNLTLLTLDTHLEGEPSETCSPNNEVIFLETVQCTSKLLADFLVWLEKNNVLQDTNVVIIGDHLHMGNKEINDQLNATANRTVFNRFYSPDNIQTNRNQLSQVDIFPSLLTMLGFYSIDGYAGLGASVFGDFEFSKGLITDIPSVYDRAQHKSLLIDSFWK